MVNWTYPSSLIGVSFIPAGPVPELAGPQRLPPYVAAAWGRVIEEVHQGGPPRVVAIAVSVWHSLRSEPGNPRPSKPWKKGPPPIVVRRPTPWSAGQPGPPNRGNPQPSAQSVRGPAISNPWNPAIAV